MCSRVCWRVESSMFLPNSLAPSCRSATGPSTKKTSGSQDSLDFLESCLLHLLDRSSWCRLEGDKPLLLSGVGRLHGGRRGVLDVLLLLGAREARRTYTREGVTNLNQQRRGQ